MSQSDLALRARQYYQQGVTFFHRGALAEAEEALRGAIRAAPDHVDARIALARVMLRRSRPDDGLRIIDAGLARTSLTNTERLRLLERAGTCAAAANRYDAAQNYFERAMARGSQKNIQVLNKVAATCVKNGRFNEGFDYFLMAAGARESSATDNQ